MFFLSKKKKHKKKQASLALVHVCVTIQLAICCVLFSLTSAFGPHVRTVYIERRRERERTERQRETERDRERERERE